MSPDQKRLPQLKLSELLDGKTISLCSGLHESSEGQIKVGIVEPTYIDSLLVDDDDQQIGYKGFLGRTIRENRSLSSIGDRVARAMGVVVDETGKLRCPPGTPNANQFTDLQMTGCMDIAGASRAIVNGVDAVADSAMNGIAGARNAGVIGRTQRVIEKHGPLDTLEQQGNALAKAFPNAAIQFKDRFLNRITPGGRRKIAEARKSFVIGLLAEADEFPDVAQSISQISDRLGFVNGRGSYAMTIWSPQTSGIGIHMSQWSATSIGNRLARRAESVTAKKQGLGTTHANGLNAETPLADRWHHFAVHEFGHAVDFHQGLSSWGFEARPGKSGAAEFVKVRPANDPLIEAELQNIAQQLQDSKNDKKISSDQLSKLGADLFAKEFVFGRQFDPAEIEMLDGVLGSAYASMGFDKSGSIHEYIAEMFAQVRIAGYGSEIPSGDQDVIVRQLRDILRDVLGREIPGADDVAGGRQLGDIKSMESADTKGMGRRLARRVQRFIPLHMRRDGDNDGNVLNPLTGEDDIPVARVRRADMPSALAQGQRSIANTRARTIIAKKPKDTISRMAMYEDDDDPDEILRRLGIPSGGTPNAKPDKWNLNRPIKPTGDMPSMSRPKDDERRLIKFDGVSLGEMQALGDELIDFDEQLRKEFADSVDERNKKRVNKLKFFLLGLLRENRIAQDGKNVTIEATEDLLKRIYKGLEALNNLSEMDLIDEDLYPMITKMRTDLISQARRLYRSDFSDFPVIEKSIPQSLEVKAVFRRPGKRGGRAIRRIFKKPDFDGDGDGFITNPRTGRDDLPFNAPRAATVTPKKRSLLASLTKPKKEPTSQMAWAQPADPDPSSDSSWAGRLRSLRKSFDSVKDRPWGPIAIRAAEIESVVEARFGKLETADDIKKAIKTALPTTKVRFRVDDEFLENPSVRAEIVGYLYSMTRQPDHFIHMRKLEVLGSKTSDTNPPRSGAGTMAAFQKRWTESGGSYIDHITKGTKLDGTIILSTKGLGDDGKHLPYYFKDTTSTQVAQSYLRHIDETDALAQGLVTEEEVYNTTIALMSIGSGIHESGHLMHYARSSVWAGKESPDEIVQKVDEALLDVPGTRRAAFKSWFATELAESIDIFAKVNAMGGPQMLMAEIDVAPDGPQKDAMVALAEALSNNYLVSNPILPLYLGGDHDSEIRQQFFEAMRDSGGDVQKALAKLFWGDNADDNNTSEELFRDMMDYANSQGLDQETADDVIEQMNQVPELAVATALDKLLTDRMWDDLTPAEIKALRANWKYLSSYAKDKNSFYEDRHASRPSVEGVAEAFTARAFGFSFIKDKPEAEAALNKLLTWIMSMPEPAIATAFDQLIANIGDIDNLGDDDVDGSKSLYYGLDNASKDLFLLLGLREPS